MDIAPPITGTLPASGTVATGVGLGQAPFVAQLDSTAAGRAISVSVDGGETFFALTPTFTTAGAIVCTWSFPVSQFEFAGSAGDEYNLL